MIQSAEKTVEYEFRRRKHYNKSNRIGSLLFQEMGGVSIATEWFLGAAAALPEIGRVWEMLRASVLVPLVRASLCICVLMSTVLMVEMVYVGSVVIYVNVFKRTPEKRYKWEAMEEDAETGNAAFPMVLVQIPLFNEIEVYKVSIGAACKLAWPADRLRIQVLDDSSDILIKEMVEKECLKWASQGIDIRYINRQTRQGFKAGALKEGMEYEYVRDCEHVAIFDADYQPEPDFLRRAVPFLIHNPDVAVVQARCRFVNADECVLTKLQEISMDFHFIVEQEFGSSLWAFCSFDGSAGVLKMAAIREAGGWKDRTTVEDMDLSVRAGLEGWKFLYVGSLEVKSELPSTFKAYRSQQFRWFSGPANLFRKILIDICKNKKLSLWKKAYMIYNFFFVRKIVAPMSPFFAYCLVLPWTILLPEVEVSKLGAVFGPMIISIINFAFTTPRSLHLIVLWTLFEGAISFHRTKAVFSGLLGTQSSKEWLVTRKLGDSMNNKSHSELIAPTKSKFQVLGERILLPELGFAVFLFMTGCYGFLYTKDYYSIYLFIQAITFTVVGLGFIGKIVPS